MNELDALKQRAERLRDLVELRRPLAEAVRALGSFDWDCDRELVILTRADASRMLDAVVRGELSAPDASEWAEALAGRDDLGLEPGHEETLKTFLFEISSPELFDPVVPANARTWLERL